MSILFQVTTVTQAILSYKMIRPTCAEKPCCAKPIRLILKGKNRNTKIDVRSTQTAIYTGKYLLNSCLRGRCLVDFCVEEVAYRPEDQVSNSASLHHPVDRSVIDEAQGTVQPQGLRYLYS